MKLEDYLAAIKDKPEFVHIDKGDYSVIDYIYIDNHSFDNPLCLDCRGLKFKTDGTVLARPFHKFFNLGEKGTTFDITRPHTLTTKRDGSMIHPAIVGGELLLMTRKGHTDVAKMAEVCLTGALKDFMVRSLKSGWTPIYEFTSPQNRVVLTYDTPSLHLLAMRSTESGRYFNPRAVAARARDLGLDHVEHHDSVEDLNIFLKHAKELTDLEGYVIQFHDGDFIKLKADEYVTRHRALDDISNIRKRLDLIAHGNIDDIKPLLAPPVLAEVETLEQNFWHLVHDNTLLVEEILQAYGHLDRGVFAREHALKLQPPYLKAAAFAGLDGKDIHSTVVELTIKNWNT